MPQAPATEQYAIVAEGLAKHFGKRGNGIQALAGVSFQVPRQSVFSILGPNGAGKTTLIRILTTIMRPDEGSARIEGFDIRTQPLAVKQNIGVVFQANQLNHYLSVWHNLTLHAQMHGMSKAEYEPEITRLLKAADLYDRRFAKVYELSGGMQRRVVLIRALIHKPKLLFLDEPTTGLDPHARRELWQTIRDFRHHATVILTTHYLEEADFLSDHVLMVNHGKVVRYGTPRELKQAIAPNDLYEVELSVPKAKAYAATLPHIAPGIQAVEPCEDDYTLQLQLAAPELLKAVLDNINPAELVRVGRKEINLETVFLRMAAEESA
jgi:ABC-2 type transport system ATP-binding protein